MEITCTCTCTWLKGFSGVSKSVASAGFFWSWCGNVGATIRGLGLANNKKKGRKDSVALYTSIQTCVLRYLGAAMWVAFLSCHPSFGQATGSSRALA